MPQKVPKINIEFWKQGDTDDDSNKCPYKLWVYDLESCVKLIDNEVSLRFETTEDGQFVLHNGQVRLIETQKGMHDVNLVVYRNVFEEGSEVVLRGPRALDSFVTTMLNVNHGRNICIAHNGSGYDSRLVFETATKYSEDFKLVPITRGTKFMQLKVGQTIFRDSLLHLPGSLANLSKSFFGDIAEKGYFPHLFNSEENYGYVGMIPAKKYFDLTFSVSDEKGYVAFNTWYNSWLGKTWTFQHELEKYCKNDVMILGMLVEAYHTICVGKFKISPWFSTTAPSYVHSVVKSQISTEQFLQMPKGDLLGCTNRIKELAWMEHWGVLVSNEYWFARAALRGGRTDVRKLYHTVDKQDWDRGVRIRYQDIVSMYPFVQIAREYPVGLPSIWIYDRDYYPCYEHRNPHTGNFVSQKCNCTYQEKVRRVDKRLFIPDCHTTPTVEEILQNSDFFGIVCASLTPPTNLFHPVLVVWDPCAGKCIGSLEPIIGGVFTSFEFKLALQKGYRLDKLHRLDMYQKAPGLWNPFIKDLYIEKMANSEPTPFEEVQEQLLEDYSKEPFEMAEMVDSSFPRWADSPAKRQVFKIMLNSGWGKHCQRPNLPLMQIISSTDCEEVKNLFNNAQSEKINIKQVTAFNNRVMVKSEVFGKSNPSFHDSYLPAGLFVPAYGRMMLYEQLDKLDKRVLYHDTDSIVYVYDPLLYNIPESDVWGSWSVEKFDTKNGGIREFVGLGPKSYGMKAENGENYIKVKGLCLRRAHEKLLNFEIMKKTVLDYMQTTRISSISIPQFNFNYKIGTGIQTTHSFKKFMFQPSQLKGQLVDGVLYPFGYTDWEIVREEEYEES